MKNMSINTKRIGIVTFHCSYNYGSMLQATALCEFLNSNGFHAKVVNYRSSDFNQYKVFHKDNFKHPKALARELLLLPMNIKRRGSFEGYLKKYVPMTDYFDDSMNLRTLNKDFDIFIAGSDQIWNLDCTGGINDIYFLKFVAPDKKKISYAPSLAHTSFKKDYTKELTNALKGYSHVSVRERSTIQLLKECTNLPISVVIDPTLLLRKVDYDRMFDLKNTKVKAPYVFVYMLENNQELIEYANNIKDKFGIKCKYITPNLGIRSRHVKGENLYGISPREFIKVLSNATFVITNSFHATVFSILYQKKFCTFATKQSGSRMMDLLDELGISDRLSSKLQDINDDIDYGSAYKKLELYKDESMQYLINSIEN